jgi:hypothetical protein
METRKSGLSEAQFYFIKTQLEIIAYFCIRPSEITQVMVDRFSFHYLEHTELFRKSMFTVTELYLQILWKPLAELCILGNTVRSHYFKTIIKRSYCIRQLRCRGWAKYATSQGLVCHPPVFVCIRIAYYCCRSLPYTCTFN